MSDNNATFIESEEPAQLEPGLLLNDEYELIKQVGRGGMGVVWKAKDLSGERHVALKFVPPDVQRFEAEMARVRKSFASIHELQHQHICPLYALKQHPIFGYYLVMKWIEGETLDHFLLRHDGGVSLETVVKILEPIAAALDYAHGRKIIHRDVKPSNIFVQTDETGEEIRDVQLIDFGLAKEIRSSMIRVSEMGVDISGTQLYMSPEQWRGRRQTAAADQYALAVVAYEMLAGNPPFESDDKEILRRAVLEETPEEIDDVSDDLYEVLRKGLAKDAVDRYVSCGKFIASLNLGTYMNRAKAYIDKEEYDLAIAECNEAIRLAPNYADAYCSRGIAHGESSENGWDRDEGECDLAIADFTEAIRLKPDYADAYYNRGITHDLKGEYDLAIADYTEAIRLKPDGADAYKERGDVYRWNKHEYDLAIADFTEAIRLKPDDADAYKKRGEIYRNKREYDLAIADYTEVIRLKPDDADAYKKRGNAYYMCEKYETGDYDLAIADFTEVIRLKPDDADAYKKRGNAYCMCGKYETGDYDLAIADFDFAIADYTEAIRLDPDDADAYEKRGNAYESKGEYDLAIADYTEAIRLEPDEADAHKKRGDVYYNNDEYELAIVDYTEVIRLNPGDGWAFFNRGYSYQVLGQAELAEADFAMHKKLCKYS